MVTIPWFYSLNDSTNFHEEWKIQNPVPTVGPDSSITITNPTPTPQKKEISYLGDETNSQPSSACSCSTSNTVDIITRATAII